MDYQLWPGFLSVCFMAIVFVQSGFDKLFNYKREMGWIRQKFSRSSLHDYVGVLFGALTIAEIASGVLCVAGVAQLFFTSEKTLAIFGATAASATMLMLIFGQRITRDYTGAASLVPYFIACVMGLYLLY